jgi:hypothetical protein
MSSFNEKIDELIKSLEETKALAKEIKKTYKVDTKKKTTKKSESSESNDNKKKYGITEPKILPPNIYEFIKYALINNKLSKEFLDKNDIYKDFTTETLVARTKVYSTIYNYIQTNNLYLEEGNRSAYKPDEKLKELFEMKNEEALNLKNIQTFLKRAYDKFKSDDQNNKKQKQKKDEIEVEVEDEVVEEVEDETENDSD